MRVEIPIARLTPHEPPGEELSPFAGAARVFGYVLPDEPGDEPFIDPPADRSAGGRLAVTPLMALVDAATLTTPLFSGSYAASSIFWPANGRMSESVLMLVFPWMQIDVYGLRAY